MTRSLLVTLAVLAASCGLTSPGGGSGTLYVVARLTSDGSTPGSQARVTVRQFFPQQRKMRPVVWVG